MTYRRPFFAGLYPTNVGGYGGAFGWTQGIDVLLQLRAQLVQLACRRASTAASRTATRTRRTTRGRRRSRKTATYFFYDRNLNKGLTGWDRTHTFNLLLIYELPFGKEKKWGTDWSPMADAFLGGWQFNADADVPERNPV